MVVYATAGRGLGINGLGGADRKVGGRLATEIFHEQRLLKLAQAACEGDLSGIERELKVGADPNGKGAQGVTPLFWALECKDLKGVEALLKAGAGPNYRIPYTRSAGSLICDAATFKDPAFLKLLLRYHGDPNATQANSPWTALRLALSLGMNGGGWENYTTLLNAGADINRSYAGFTIADSAAAWGRFDRVVELLGRGYHGDLNDLGAFVQNGSIDLKSAQFEWQQKAKSMLEKRGVKFPVAAGMDRNSGRVEMNENRALTVYWMGGRSRDGASVKASEKTIKSHEAGYDEMIKRVDGLAAYQNKGIPRRPEDPLP